MKTKIQAHLRRHQIFYASIRTAAMMILLLIAALIVKLYH